VSFWDLPLVYAQAALVGAILTAIAAGVAWLFRHRP